MKLQFFQKDIKEDSHASYEVRQFIRDNITGTKDVKEYAKITGYYKQGNFNINDVMFIINKVETTYNVYLGNVFYDCLEQELDYLLFSVDVAVILYLDRYNNGRFWGNLRELGRQADMQCYYYSLFRFVKAILFDEKSFFMGNNIHNEVNPNSFNTSVLRVAYRILYKFDVAWNYNQVSELFWYKNAKKINEVIKCNIDNYMITDKDRVKDWVKSNWFFTKECGIQPRIYSQYQKKLAEKAKQVEAERQAHKAECEAIIARREANMKRYDDMCDRFGGALPASVINW